MADTVSDVAEVVDTPVKEVVDKVVEEVEDVDEDSGDVQEDSEGDSEEVKENGTSTENGDKANGDNHAKNGDTNGVAKESDVIASKRKSGGGDAPDGLLTEGASPEKKAKLDEPVEVDANGDAQVVA